MTYAHNNYSAKSCTFFPQPTETDSRHDVRSIFAFGFETITQFPSLQKGAL